MPVDHRPDRDRPHLVLDRGRTRLDGHYRGRRLGQRVARGLGGGICRRGREGIGKRDDHHARAVGGSNEIGVGAHGRGQHRSILPERHYRQRGSAVYQNKVAAVCAGGKLRPAECVQRPGQTGHDIREGVPGENGIADLRHAPADIDARRPDLADCGYRRSSQRRANDVAGRVDVGGQQGGDDLRRLDLIHIGLRADGHLPDVADAGSSGQSKARRR